MVVGEAYKRGRREEGSIIEKGQTHLGVLEREMRRERERESSDRKRM